MQCVFITLGKTRNGKILKCANCSDNIAISYNNITQSLGYQDFYNLKIMIDRLDVEAYFKKFPDEEKLHIRTDYKGLFFSFLREEIYELKMLLSEAAIKIKIYENIQNNLN